MSAMAIALLPFIAVLVAFLVTRGVANARAQQSIDPTCGRCGYIVRGLEVFVCPECGGDLREVGIVPPGGRKPMSRKAWLTIWAAVSAVPAMIVGSVLAPHLAPTDMLASRRRVIFIQSPTVHETIQVEQLSRRRILGQRIDRTMAVPMQTMTLDLKRGRASDVLSVALPDRAAHFVDAAGKRVDGTFDAEFVTAWLNANGAADATVPARARDVVAAVAEMDGPPGRAGYSTFSPNSQRGNLPDVSAHPAYDAVRPQPTAWTTAMPLALGGVIWLIALALVVAAGRARRPA